MTTQGDHREPAARSFSCMLYLVSHHGKFMFRYSKHVSEEGRQGGHGHKACHWSQLCGHHVAGGTGAGAESSPRTAPSPSVLGVHATQLLLLASASTVPQLPSKWGAQWAGAGGWPRGGGAQLSFPAATWAQPTPCWVLQLSDHDGILRYIVSWKV